ncbi:MAG: hypothetical protein EZS28_015953 [Streblomastix strix]|uniref:Cytochrome b5 heme-binding domain-containing protein n=1 Tax=Streblomastix strix TaxID=222440 RepID=A0A5J4W1W0_9EUKA|nr:MAG: hypothetical protein EZS28_015953 [Streblomastix strix]
MSQTFGSIALVQEISKLREITQDELSQHKVPGDLWVRGIVLCLSNFKHRGGQIPLQKSAGTDVTESFERYHRYVNCAFLPGVQVIGRLQGVSHQSNLLHPSMQMPRVKN